MIVASLWPTILHAVAQAVAQAAGQVSQNPLAVVVGIVGLGNILAVLGIAWRGGSKIGAMNEILTRLAADVRDLVIAEKTRIANDATLTATVKDHDRRIEDLESASA